MKNKILLFVVVLLFVIYLSIEKVGSVSNNTSFSDYKLVVKNLSTNQLFDINMEDYLIGVLAGEMPVSFEFEALKAQAVASRTYAYYKASNNNLDYDLTTDNKTQVYLDDKDMRLKWKDNYEKSIKKIKQAIKDTTGEIITYDGNAISAYYFSMSNGMTESSKEVFNENKPYLVSVTSLENNQLKNYSFVKTISIIDFCQKLSLTKCEKIIVNDIQYNETHHVTKVVINNNEYTGIQFRKLLNLKSTDFKIETNSNEIKIITNGHGHDVGMSQYGANLMAKKGYTYKDILKHYYTGVDIEKINV